MQPTAMNRTATARARLQPAYPTTMSIQPD